MNLTNLFIEYWSSLVLVIAGVCILVSVITEFTKDIWFLSKIPTSLQVLLLCQVVCIVSLFMYLSYTHTAFIWYYLVAVVFLAFICAIVCTQGWDYFYNIVKRYKQQ